MMAVAALAVASQAANAYDILVEAENPAEMLQWELDVRNSEGSEVSQGKGLQVQNVHRENYARYTFEAPESGTYLLKVFYVTCNTRWAQVKVNDGRPALFRFDSYTPNWDGRPEGDRQGVESMEVKVNCVKGENTLTLSAVYGPDEPYTPCIDRFELTKCENEHLAEWSYETDRVTVECENYSAKSGSASVGSKGAFSQGKGIGFGDSAGEAAYTVELPESGAYLLTLHYSTLQNRWISVRANRQTEVQNILFSRNSQDWGNNAGEWLGRRAVILYLEEGRNTITLGQLNGYSPDLDLFTLDRVDLSYALDRPESSFAMHKAALSDIAKWSSPEISDLSVLRDHNESTSASVSSGHANVVLEFPGEIIMSGYAWASGSDTEDWKVETSTDGAEWTATEKKFRESAVDDNVNTFVLESRTSAVRFVRLCVESEGAAEVGEFAVFGNFAQQPAGGLLCESFTDYESTHGGFVSGGWNEGVANLFDYNADTQFTVTQGDDGEMGDADDIVITVFMDQECALGSYLLATHNSTGYYRDRSPREWTLEAYDYDEDAFVVVDSRNDMNFVAPASTLVIGPEQKIVSDTYRLAIKNRRNLATHLSMLQFYGEGQFDFGNDDNTQTGVSQHRNGTCSIALSGCDIVMTSDTPCPYTVYASDGRAIASGTVCGTCTVTPGAGFYIVRLGDRTAKAAIR